MKKAIKIIIGAIIAIVALVVVLILALPLWLGPIVKPAANAAVPKLTKTDFHLGILSLNPYTGRFELGDMQLANPKNYDEKHAVKLDKLVLDVAMSTLTKDTIHVQEVLIDGAFVSYVSADGVNNFDQIQYNVAGGKEKYEAQQAKAKAAREAKAAQKGEAKEEEKAAPSKKVVIDKLTINNIKFKYGFLTIPVPSITLTDLGKESDGITFKELMDNIMQAILKSASAIGDGVKALGGAVTDGAKAVTEGATKAVGAVSDAASEGAKALTEGATKAVDAVGNVAGEGAKAVSESATKAVEAVGNVVSTEGATKAVGAVSNVAGEGAKAVTEGATKAVDAVGAGAKKIGDGAGKAVDAVGEGAKKAADALKSLF